MCAEWLDDFQAFHDWAMANGYADDLTIDRIDVNGNYEPSNCRWATWIEQAHNKRLTEQTHPLTPIEELRAKTGMTQTEFGKWLGIPMRTIQNWENGQRSAPEYVVELIAFRVEHADDKEIENARRD